LIGSGGRDADDRDNVFADTHSRSADEEKFTTTEVIDCPDTGKSRDDIDDVGDNGDDEGVFNTSLSEESRSVVENELLLEE
jgi:hypothetical protein